MFRNRCDAGQQLAQKLAKFATQDPVVLALVRGGLPVGLEVAEALHAPLDIVLVRKIGAPYQAELAVGAVADGPEPEVVVNPDILKFVALPAGYVEQEAKAQLAEIERRSKLYLRNRRRIAIAGKTAIVVDDGIATGATTRAALHAVRLQKPKRLVLAVPVAPQSTIDALREDADEIVYLQTPEPFHAIGFFYADFHQVSDEEVISILERAARSTAKQPSVIDAE